MKLSKFIKVVLVALGVVSLVFNVWQVWELSGTLGHSARAEQRVTGGRAGMRGSTVDPGVAAALAPLDAQLGNARVARVSASRRKDAKLFSYLGMSLQTLLDDAALTTTSGANKAKFQDPTDLLRAQWVTHGQSSTRAGEIRECHVLWGTWVTNLEFFDHRLHDGLLINSMLGLEQDALGTPATFAQTHRRCIQAHGYRRCDHASPSLFIHAHTDPSRFETVFGEDTLADLATWRDLAKNDVRAIWVAKPASYARSQVHRAMELFGLTQLIASNDKLPTGIWSLAPYVTSPLLWKSFRYFVRAWAVVTSAVPLRVYVLQDGWAHLAAEPYKEEQLSSNYKTRCMHFHSPENCRFFVDKTTLRVNTQEFQGDLSSRRGEIEPYGFWQRKAWPSVESAVTRTVLMAWPQLAQYELILRREGFRHRRVAMLDLLLFVDDSGAATVHDVDTSGVAADESLECSLPYELDALMVAGVNAFPSRPDYRAQMVVELSAFCRDRGGCIAEDARQLIALHDERQHAGNFKLTFPVGPDGAGKGEPGCGPLCHFLEDGPSLGQREGGSGGTSQSDRIEARRQHELTWAYMRVYPPLPHRGPQFSRDGSCRSMSDEDEAFLRIAMTREAADGRDVVEEAARTNRTQDDYLGKKFSLRPEMLPAGVRIGGSGDAAKARRESSLERVAKEAAAEVADEAAEDDGRDA